MAIIERLIESGHQHFGVVEQSYAGGTVRVITIERTLVDILADPDPGGSWDEIYQSLTRADSIDVAAAAAYCQVLDGGPVLRAKVGFFLDQHRGLWGIDASDLDPFRPQGPGPFFPFDLLAPPAAPLRRGLEPGGTSRGRGTPMGNGLLTA